MNEALKCQVIKKHRSYPEENRESGSCTFSTFSFIEKTSFYSAELQNGASWKMPGSSQNTKKTVSSTQGRKAAPD